MANGPNIFQMLLVAYVLLDRPAYAQSPLIPFVEEFLQMLYKMILSSPKTEPGVQEVSLQRL